MWRVNTGLGLLVDLYELTMAQVYFSKKMDRRAYFEVTIRRLPEQWGFFVMAGLAELQEYLERFRFTPDDLQYLRSTGMFSGDFLEFLATLRADVKVRAMPEGTVFFPGEPILEVAGPVICAQVLESYILNILGFSIIAATLAARTVTAAGGLAVIDFGLRRCQGPVASLRAARAAQIAGFKATSNVHAAKELGFAAAGTMAHSFVQAYDSQEQAFRDFAEAYGANAILLVDTYDCVEGIKMAANVASDLCGRKGVRIRGIRIDSGDLVELSRFAREYFDAQNLGFLKVFVSGDLDEFKIADLLARDAAIDGFGVGTRFAVSRHAPAVEIVYKLVQYGDRGVTKTSPDKISRPGRKSVLREKRQRYVKDTVCSFTGRADDLLKSFTSAEPIEAIQQRLAGELGRLDDSIKAVRSPAEYTVVRE